MLSEYKNRFGETPVSVWPVLQAYDAMNMVLESLETIDFNSNNREKSFSEINQKLKNIEYYKGCTGNLRMGKGQAVKGIYFSMYEYVSENKMKRSL